MLEALCKDSYIQFTTWLEVWLSAKFWHLKVSVVSVLIIFVFSFPNYDLLTDDIVLGFHRAINAQISFPFTPQVHPIASHEAKIGLRITVPLVAHCLGVGVLGCLIIQHVLGFVFFSLSSVLVYSVTKDKILAAFFTLSLSCSYIGKSFFLDVWGAFDGYAFLLLLICMLPKIRIPVLFTCLVASHFVDERAIFATGFIFVWWVYQELPNERNLFKCIYSNPKTIVIIASILVTFIIRQLLSSIYGLNMPTDFVLEDGIGIIRQNWSLMPIGLFSSIEFFWLFILGAIIILMRNKQYILCMIFTFTIIVTQVVALMVYDITRSSAYSFPCLIIAYVLISKNEQKATSHKIAFCVLALMFLFPSQYVETYSGCTWESPIIPKIFKYLP